MTHQGEITVTSDSDKYNQLEPLEEAVARKKELDEHYRKTLQPLHVAFVNNFFMSQMDIQQAADAVGMPVKKCQEWLEEGHAVAEYIARRLETWSNEVDVTMEEIILGLKQEATRITDSKTDTQAARVAAWDKLARIKGMYDKGKKKERPTVAVQINLNQGDRDGDIKYSGDQ